ncbi:hypothetical protein [Glaciimonas immobilis]|uniref:Pentapeptide MXKDX repeat protein n=1 Tax=Glaciimonas immobilis TaxID=728004 RepID=A0A840RWQ0_9BURK|nr:hypothetical protein [Glaciimonas immobilis]KAF3997476.1 hypothetical protein HAV38_12410 [Glaciimonas immobilis]MBB5200849.1 hypothetical protein [Glaciimonas immobilis]
MKKYLMNLAVLMAIGTGFAFAQNDMSKTPMPNDSMGKEAASAGMNDGTADTDAPKKKTMKKKMHKHTAAPRPMTDAGMDKPDTKH